jgi:hypothetical protein
MYHFPKYILHYYGVELKPMHSRIVPRSQEKCITQLIAFVSPKSKTTLCLLGTISFLKSR